jgi:hypothetical protein
MEIYSIYTLHGRGNHQSLKRHLETLSLTPNERMHIRGWGFFIASQSLRDQITSKSHVHGYGIKATPVATP